jgi:hypothetical protein
MEINWRDEPKRMLRKRAAWDALKRTAALIGAAQLKRPPILPAV